jgi:hypothetical protein
MSNAGSLRDNPEFLLEAARVLNAAGTDYWGAAAAIAELAWKTCEKAPQEVQDAIAGDAAALRLAERLPGGYQGALEVLKTRIDDPGKGFDRAASIDKGATEDKKDERSASDARLRLFGLRALALGQQYRDIRRKTGKPVKDMEQLREHIKADLQFVFKWRQEWMKENEYFWKLPPGEPEADLADLYRDDPAFESFIESPDMTKLPVVTIISPNPITSSEAPQTLTLTGSNLSKIKKSGFVTDQTTIDGELGKADDKSVTVTIRSSPIGVWNFLVGYDAKAITVGQLEIKAPV